MKKTLLSVAVKGALGLTAAAVMVPVMPVFAQEDAKLVEEVIVTGSRIKRQDFESASPIATVDQEVFKQMGALTAESVLNASPQFVPSVTSTSNNPSNGGQANVELRGLGTKRTLVLVDGRRVVPSNASGVVDANLIPPSMLESVEIITGGASATYGSDAIAGVVNFKMRKLDGIEVDTRWGQTSEGDGAESSITLSAGTSFANGRGHVSGSLSWAERESVLAGDREHTQMAMGWSQASRQFIPLGSGSIREGHISNNVNNAFDNNVINQIFTGYGVDVGNGIAPGSLAFNSDGTLFSTANLANFRGDKNDPLQPAVAPYSYNYAPPNMLVLPLERTSFFGTASFEINDHAELYAQALYADYTASQALAATPLSAAYVSADNPFIHPDLKEVLDSRPNPNAPVAYGVRFEAAGPRVSSYDYSTGQFIAGVKGDIVNNWSYDVYASYGRNDRTETQSGNISRSKFEELTFAADGGASICEGGLNPFGLGNMSQACVDHITLAAQNEVTLDQTIVEATFTGPAFSMPAGDALVAFGAMYKKDEYELIPDATLSKMLDPTSYHGSPRPDIAGFNAQQALAGETDSKEVFMEVALPLLANAPGVHSLNLDLGYRYADYSTAGGVDSYKAEMKFNPVEPLMFRGTYQRAVRAPNIAELFAPTNLSFPSISGVGDPCDVDNDRRKGSNKAQVEQLCVAQGIPQAALDSYTYTNSQVQGYTGGNVDLQAETADTFSLGFVFTSPFDGIYGDMQLSADLFDIEIEGAIGSVSASTAIDRCFDTEYNPTLSNDNGYCQLFRRNSAGEIVDALMTQQNLGGIKTRGLDIQWDWRVDAGPGSLKFNWMATYTYEYAEQVVATDEFTEYAGVAGDAIGTTFPHWKWNFGIGYDIGDATIGLRWRYIDKMVDQNISSFKIPSMDYFDLNAAYSFQGGNLDGLSIRAGIMNLTNEDPILYPSYIQSNTDPSQYDVLGRRYFISANYSF